MIRHLCLLAGLLLAAGAAHAQYIDSTFGTYGIVRDTFNGPNESCSKVLVLTDGKVMAGGTAAANGGFTEFALSRYDTSGVLDPAFGTNGKVILPSGGTNNVLTDIVIQADGKVVATGIAKAGSFSPWSTMTVRLNADGSIDNTFGTAGIVTTQVGTKCDAYDVLIQPDGKILICGTEYDNSFYILVRYNADGSLDNTFGTGGIQSAVAFGTGTAVALQPDGKILVSGEFWGGMTPFAGIARHNADGTLDASFGFGGVLQIPSLYPGSDLWGAHDIDILPSGKILVPLFLETNNIAHQPAIVRLTANGQVDATFGNNGYAIGTYCNFYETGEEVEVQTDGKILIAGRIQGTGNLSDSLFVMRFDTSGAPDLTFGNAGRITALLDAGGTRVGTITLQPNGKFIVGGSNGGNSSKVYSLARYRYTSGNTLSVAGAAATSDIRVYPNPTSGKLTISAKDNIRHVEISDLAGRSVLKAGGKIIDVSSLRPALYIITVTTEQSTVSSLFEKK